MKNLLILLVFVIIIFILCKFKYLNLENGLYVEFVINKGIFVVKFYEEILFIVVNFIELVEGKYLLVDLMYKGKFFFNGLIFYRVIKDFMI